MIEVADEIYDKSQVNITTAESKFWEVYKMVIKPITKSNSMKRIKNRNRGVKIMMSNNK